MQKFLLANLIIIFGLTLSVVYSVLLFGVGNTTDAVKVLLGRSIAIFFPTDVYAHFSPYINNSDSVSRISVLGQFIHPNNKQFRSENMKFPLIVPTDGIAGHKDFLYLPDKHPGIDIWTNLDGTGLNGDKKGYPVLSACSGRVAHYKNPNEEIEIICDKLPDIYKNLVPSLNIKILYSHLGDGETLDSFHELKVGQRVNQGEIVGYQGNKSSFAPENRVVHLHFGVYDLSANTSPPPPLDPMLYIGVDTHKVGQLFISGIN